MQSSRSNQEIETELSEERISHLRTELEAQLINALLGGGHVFEDGYIRIGYYRPDCIDRLASYEEDLREAVRRYMAADLGDEIRFEGWDGTTCMISIRFDRQWLQSISSQIRHPRDRKLLGLGELPNSPSSSLVT